ncbi:hypothetical protein [Paenibacillus sp. Aloe-11]|uniref:hypothetical protein n=1 Tax=Paenibacillus sp. Aloe-11 TaxID=1050222 RepID=UPI00024F00E6|nr:hypothetical protein [Paenibacillus sp. Aloe-11]EHS59471.1 hypothetical protein WG8_0686 [Paenibacillus sp. Aloe-11]
MAETFIQKRKRELGMVVDSAPVGNLNSNSDLSFIQRRKMELGMIEDTRPTLVNTLKNTVKSPEVKDFVNKGLNYAGQEMQRQAAEREKNRLKLPSSLIIGPGFIENSTFTQATQGNRDAIGTYRAATGKTIKPLSAYEQWMEGIDQDIKRFPAIAPARPIAEGIAGLLLDNKPGQFTSRTFGQIGSAVTGDKPYYDVTTGNATADKVADFTGALAGVAALGINPAAPGVQGQNLITGPLAAAEAGLATRTGNALTNTISRQAARIPGVSARTADSFTRGALTGAGAGAVSGAAIGLNQDQTTGKEILHNAGMGAALGAGGDIVLRGAGLGLREALNKIKGDRAIPEIDEILALPLGRGDQRMARAGQRSNLSTSEGPIVNPTNWAPEPLALPAGRNTSGTTGRLARLENPYRTKFENLIRVANQTEFTPGREAEELEQLWSSMASRKDPGLSELIDRAYPARRQVTSDLAQKARQNQATREKYGVPLPVREAQPSTFVGEAASPVQRVGARPGASREPVQRVNESSINRQQNFNINDPEVPKFLRVRQERIDAANARAAAASEPPVNAPRVVEEAPVSPIVNEAQPPTGQAGQVERGFASTLRQSEKTPAEFAERLDSTYRPITNAETVQQANRRLTEDVRKATNYVLDDSRFTAEKAATAQRLIDHYNQQKNYEMAVNIANKVAEEATNAGQSIQALSLFERLTPEGVLVRAQKLANSINEKLPTKAEKVKITDDMAAKMTDLAETTQRMTGVKGLANDVVDILKRAKDGEKLNDIEIDQLSRFVKESKQFVKESSRKVNPTPPRRPPAMKDQRVRDNVVKFLDAQEEAAKERLRARGIQISSTPLDVWADYAVIGAAKMGKGVVKFSDWSEAMVKEFGEGIRPSLEGLYARSKEAFELSSKKVSQDTISRAEKLTEKIIREKNLTDNEAESLLVLARKVSGLSGEAKRIASQDLQVILQSLDKPGLLKKISSAQTIAQLLNPKTQVRNVLGNELFYRVERLNKFVATPFDIARSKITGGQRYVTFRTNNQGQFWKNWMEGSKAGWNGVNINGLQTQYDLAGQAFRSKYNPMTYLEKTLGAALRGFDNAAYMRAYNDTMGEMATLDAINKGVKPTREYVQDFINRADENLTEIAGQYGKYVTFQDKNSISKFLSTVKRGLNAGKDFGIGDLVLKYPNTPGALLMRALEFSPVGFVRSARILEKGARFAESNPREATLALSRAMVGTFGMMGMGYFLMDKGIITGEASKDKDIRSLQQASGQGQYQVNLSALQRFVESGFNSDVKLEEGDLLYTYDWMQPVSIAISMGANINKNVKDEKEADESPVLGTLAAGYNSFAGGINTLQQQSVLKGLADAASGYAGQTATDKIVDVLSDIPSSFIPTILNQIKQTQDNSKRETYSPNKLEQSLNKAQAKMPGLAERLPKKYDTLGQEQRNYQDPSLTNIFLNPGFPSRYKLSPEAQEVVNLITETEDETLAPRVPSKTLKGNKLTGEQFSRLSQVQGEETARRIGNLRGTTEQKAKQMEKLLRKSSETAREQIMREYNLSAK